MTNHVIQPHPDRLRQEPKGRKWSAGT